jgi:hypothetical protein
MRAQRLALYNGSRVGMTWQSSQAQLVEIPSGFNSGGPLGLAWTHRPKVCDSVVVITDDWLYVKKFNCIILT